MTPQRPAQQRLALDCLPPGLSKLVRPPKCLWLGLVLLARQQVKPKRYPGLAVVGTFAGSSTPSEEDVTIVFARDDDYFFGILHSKPHELWALRMGTSLEDRPRYTPTTTFDTFPFPWPPGKEPKRDPRVKAIAQAARELVQQRDAWLNPSGATEAELKKHTLTNLYNQRPTWLELAHRKLDEAVFDAYGWPHDISDEDILARLLALNLGRAKGQKT